MSITDNLIDDLSKINYEEKKYFYGRVQTQFKITPKRKAAILSEFPVPMIPEKRDIWSIQNCKDGEYVKGILGLVTEVTKGIATNKKPFLKLTFTNGSGSFKSKLWSDHDSVEESLTFFNSNQVVNLSGKVEEYPKGSGNKSLTLSSYLPVLDKVNPFSLLPSSEDSIEDMTVELVSRLQSLSEPYRSVALGSLKVQWDDFCIKPAAKGHHHAYLGGLLRHTLCMVRLGMYLVKTPILSLESLVDTIREEFRKSKLLELSKEIPNPISRLVWGGDLDHIEHFIYKLSQVLKTETLNPDLFIASIPSHDIGKLIEYSQFGEGDKYRYLFSHCSDIADYDNQGIKEGGFIVNKFGTMVGHMSIGTLMFEKMIVSEKIPLSLEDEMNFLHCILSHHGKPEWGSIAPVTPEAILLHLVDFMDSRFEKHAQSI